MLFTTFLACLATGVALLFLSGRLLRFVKRHDTAARQAVHASPTLRLGGVGVFIALWVSVGLQPQLWSTLGILLFCAVPLFMAGLLEDLGLHQSVGRRLLSAILSCLLAIWATGTYISGLELAALDGAFAVIPFAVAFTLLSSVGIVNAFNLIDGLNGLASSAALVALVALAAVAQKVGHADLMLPILTTGCAIMGFLVLNFPKGGIFLGDGGAYLFGFLLAWFAIHMMHHTTKASPWAFLLIFFWPIADTLWAMWRRAFRKGPVSHPDRMHFHHVILRLLEIRVLGRGRRTLANPLATAFLVLPMIPPAIAGVLLATDTPAAILASVAFAAVFLVTYLGAVRLACRRGSRRGNRRVRQSAMATARPAATGKVGQ